MNIYNLIKKIILLLGDSIVFFFALWLTLLIRFNYNYSSLIWSNHLPLFSLVAIIWLLTFYSFDLYQLSYYPNLARFLNIFGKAITIALVVAIIFFYILGNSSSLAPKTILLILTVIFIVVFIAWRYLFQKIFKLVPFKQNVLIYGFNQNLETVINELKTRDYLFNLVGCYGFSNDPNLKITIPIYSIDFSLAELVKDKKINLIIFIDEPQTADAEELAQILKHQINIVSLVKFYEIHLQRIPLSFLKTGWFLDNLTEGEKKFLNVPKRLLDLVFSIIFLIPSLIILPLLAVIIKINDHGPIFFKQIRSGQNNQPFLAIKLRTMTIDSEKNGPQWAQKNDTRITSVGKYLRKLRLDEIPQLFNIIKGEMSFVGPRPERPELIEKIEPEVPFYGYRSLVKPGLTGWAQINYPYGASIEDTKIKLEYDLYYVKNRSLLLDLSIILKTINAVFKGWG